MKKLVFAILITTLVCLSAFGGGALVAFAQVSEAECDRVFIETVDNLIGSYYTGNVQITADKEPVYDIQLEGLGYIYQFNASGENGYAIVINSGGFYECTEIYFDAQNPYEDYSGTKVYVTTFLYLVYENDTYINPDDGKVIGEEIIAILAEKAFLGTGDFVFSSETIAFTARTDNNYNMVMRAPQYVTNSSSSGCTPVAGANIIIYFDRYATELIPNFTPGSSLGANYLYKSVTTETSQVVTTLISYMGTDADGTTIAGFKTGMAQYCTEKGYAITYSSCMSGSSFNYSYAKQKIESGQPLVIFTDPYTVASMTISGSTESISTMYSDVAHTMAVFGYRDITYTLSGGQIRNDCYLFVSTGFDNRISGYCKLNSTTIIDDAYAININ